MNEIANALRLLFKQNRFFCGFAEISYEFLFQFYDLYTLNCEKFSFLNSIIEFFFFQREYIGFTVEIII